MQSGIRDARCLLQDPEGCTPKNTTPEEVYLTLTFELAKLLGNFLGVVIGHVAQLTQLALHNLQLLVAGAQGCLEAFHLPATVLVGPLHNREHACGAQSSLEVSEVLVLALCPLHTAWGWHKSMATVQLSIENM